MRPTIAFLLVVCLHLPATAQTTTRVSHTPEGFGGNGNSVEPSISADGRWVAFRSAASDLVFNDTNGVDDVFVWDRTTRVIERVSVGSNRTQANGRSERPAISPDGRWVAFRSLASNLDPTDDDGEYDHFLHDRVTGVTARLSRGIADNLYSEIQTASIPTFSADGLWLVFDSRYQLFAQSLLGGSPIPVSVDRFGDPMQCSGGVLSANGRYVAFATNDSRAISNPPFLGILAYVHDRDPDGNGVFDEGPTANSNRLVSFGRNGDRPNNPCYASGISPRGRFVSFLSAATNMAGASASGVQAYVHDLERGETVLASTSDSGEPANTSMLGASLLDEGRLVLFSTLAPNLAGESGYDLDVFLKDRDRRLDGTFDEPGDTRITRVSLGPDDVEAIGHSHSGVGTPDGRSIAFASSANNFDAGDTTIWTDVYLREYPRRAIERVVPELVVESGGEPVRIDVSPPMDLSGAEVWIGGRRATVVDSTGRWIRALTPPLSGPADVSVAIDGEGFRLERAIRYAPIEEFARRGTVNRVNGAPADVLLVNATAGRDPDRTVVVPIRSPIELAVVAPPSLGTAPVMLYAWPGAPRGDPVVELPMGVGWTLFPTLLQSDQTPQPVTLLNGLDPRLGKPRLSQREAPVLLRSGPRGIPRRTTFTLQGLIRDDASFSRVGVSTTNAVIVRVR